MPLPDAYSDPGLPNLLDPTVYPTVSHEATCVQMLPGRACATTLVVMLARPFSYPDQVGQPSQLWSRLRILPPIAPSVSVHCPTISATIPEGAVRVGDVGSFTRTVTYRAGDACTPWIQDAIVFPCTTISVEVRQGPPSRDFTGQGYTEVDNTTDQCRSTLILTLSGPGCTGVEFKPGDVVVDRKFNTTSSGSLVFIPQATNDPFQPCLVDLQPVLDLDIACSQTLMSPNPFDKNWKPDNVPIDMVRSTTGSSIGLAKGQVKVVELPIRETDAECTLRQEVQVDLQIPCAGLHFQPMYNPLNPDDRIPQKKTKQAKDYTTCTVYEPEDPFDAEGPSDEIEGEDAVWEAIRKKGNVRFLRPRQAEPGQDPRSLKSTGLIYATRICAETVDGNCDDRIELNLDLDLQPACFDVDVIPGKVTFLQKDGPLAAGQTTAKPFASQGGIVIANLPGPGKCDRDVNVDIFLKVNQTQNGTKLRYAGKNECAGAADILEDPFNENCCLPSCTALPGEENLRLVDDSGVFGVKGFVFEPGEYMIKNISRQAIALGEEVYAAYRGLMIGGNPTIEIEPL